MKKALLLIAPVCLFLGSCKKDSCKTDAASLAGAYKISSVKYKVNSSVPEADYTDEYFSSPCEKDDVMNLSANGTFTLTDAGTTCTPPTSASGTWSVTGSQLIVDGEDYTIGKFDCDNLTLTYSGYFTEGDLITLNLVRQ